MRARAGPRTHPNREYSRTCETRRVDPSQAAVFAGLGDGDGFAAGGAARVDLARKVFGDAVDDFRARVGGSFVVVNDFCAGGVGEGFAVGRPNYAADADVVVSDFRFGAVGERTDDEIAGVTGVFVGRWSGADEGDAAEVGRDGDVGLAGRSGPYRFWSAT